MSTAVLACGGVGRPGRGALKLQGASGGQCSMQSQKSWVQTAGTTGNASVLQGMQSQKPWVQTAGTTGNTSVLQGMRVPAASVSGKRVPAAS
eukprot:237334-Chlamydomonas_euryale.AAC.2